MNRFFFITTIFIFFISSSFSQNFIQYNQLVNKAELSVIDSNYIKALDYYQNAFELVPFPYTTDYYNALLCAVFTDNFDIAFEYLYKLVDKGIEFQSFTENKYLEPLYDDKRWLDFEKYYNTNRERIINSFNQELKAEFDGMLERDQKSNKARYKDPNIEYKFDSTIYANSIRIKEIVNTYGFPNEEMIGVNNFRGNTFESVLLFHYFQVSVRKNMPDTVTILPILITAIQEGKLNYKNFIAYLEDNSVNRYGSNIAYLIDTNIVFLNIDSASIAVINHNRKEIGLESLEESKKKVEFYVRNVIKPKPIKKSEKEHEYMVSTLSNADNDFFIIGSGLFSIFIYKYEDVDKYLEIHKNKIFNIDTNE